MAEAMAVLSYTRKDDEFFGGYITAFRKTLETAVHVVTGTEEFRIFQDVEGIVIGEQWQKKLAKVISDSTFFVPMLTPLFFNSSPCREEVALFLAHEREVSRDDLILPVYFLSAAKLEKAGERSKDPLATELGNRQMYDWREKASIPLAEPSARHAILELATDVAAALERVQAPGAPKRDTGDTAAAPTPGAGEDARLAAHAESKREPLSERLILWVDDNPGNNVWERRGLESYGVRFVLATSTAEAEALLEEGAFSAIISDLGRPGDRRAGYSLLEHIRKRGSKTPYFIYTASRGARRVREATERGAQGLTNDPGELVEMVVTAIR